MKNYKIEVLNNKGEIVETFKGVEILAEFVNILENKYIFKCKDYTIRYSYTDYETGQHVYLIKHMRTGQKYLFYV